MIPTRLIEWTGERCVPWSPSALLVYEHLHRYLWAATVVCDRRVLDLASGEGFGAATLAESARHVVGIDLDERTVEHSRLNYVAPNLEFFVGDARDLSRFEDRSFDAVVAFEMIEHLSDQDRVLSEIARVLTQDGLPIMSTPDRQAYADENPEPNPFHVHELTTAEFTTLLRSRFENVAVWGQRAITGSALSSLGGAGTADGGMPQSFFVERVGEGWRVTESLSPLYVVAVASNQALPVLAANSILGDCGLELVRGVWESVETLRQESAAQAAASRSRIAELESGLVATQRRLGHVERSVTWQLLTARQSAHLQAARRRTVGGGSGASGNRWPRGPGAAGPAMGGWLVRPRNP